MGRDGAQVRGGAGGEDAEAKVGGGDGRKAEDALIVFQTLVPVASRLMAIFAGLVIPCLGCGFILSDAIAKLRTYCPV